MRRYFEGVPAAVSIGIFAMLLVVVYLYRVPIASWVLATSEERRSEASGGHAGHGQMTGGKEPSGTLLTSSGSGDMAATHAMETSHNHNAPKEGSHAERKILYYYDAMNPGMRSDKLGKAPDGMDLVPMYADTGEAMANMPPGTVMVSPVKQQLIGVRTDVVKKESPNRVIRTVAQVQVDETKIARIQVKIAGWVDQIYVDFIGKLVSKG